MKAYIITAGEYDDNTVIGVFSSLGKAKEALARAKEKYEVDNRGPGLCLEPRDDIEEYEVDAD